MLNPIVALTRLAASLHRENGTIAVLGFYEDVTAVTPADEADMEAANMDEPAEMAALGAKGPYGEAGFSTLARRRVTSTSSSTGKSNIILNALRNTVGKCGDARCLFASLSAVSASAACLLQRS